MTTRPPGAFKHSSTFTGSETAANLNSGNAKTVTVKAKWTSNCNDGISSVGGSKNFNYTGDVQTFNACAGRTYKLEVWGAQGGYYSSASYGGKGAKAQGDFTLSSATTLYIYVGGDGSNHSGYNGGGTGNSTYKTYGGGATHIATATGLLSSLSSSTNKILIVAGGGGGGGYGEVETGNVTYYGGGNGGKNGSSGKCGSVTYLSMTATTTCATGATQSSGGNGGGGSQNGTSCSATSKSTKNRYSGGGGGGFYGGGSGSLSRRYCGGANDGSVEDGKQGSFGLGGDYVSASNTTQNYYALSVGGGGGGSSYVNTSLGSSASYSSGARSGDGYVTITRQS